MAKIGFTGGRHVNDVIVYGNLYKIFKSMPLPMGSAFITGAALGADAMIGEWLAEVMPIGYFHRILVPANHDQIDKWWERNFRAIELRDLGWLQVVQMPEGTDYKDRNQAIVDQSDWVIGFPPIPEDHPNARRSGTWQTVRMARRAEKLFGVYITGAGN